MKSLLIRACFPFGIVLLWTAAACGQNAKVGRFSLHEVSLSATGRYDNPYTQLSADALLVEPDGHTVRRVPLFWDGGEVWRFRFAPDRIGAWTWSVESDDPGLNGRKGSFDCVASDRRGSFQPLTRSPYHFQYQSGEKVWFLGDTAWAYLTDSEEERHDRAAAERYVSNRARQGFNAIHVMLLSEAGWGNRNGPPWTDIAAERINPAYFQEADERIAFANSRNVVVGIALAWALKGRRESYAWGRIPSPAARERYARYAAARYAAYDVYFLVSGEWQGEIRNRQSTEEAIRAEFVRLGDVVRASDAHGRMIGIHPLGRYRGTHEFTTASTWMSFGDYQQNYQDLHGYILKARTASKPVVNGEYAYWLRANNRAGEVDKPHSYTLEDIRAATWDIVMAGGYLVAGFGSTYMGGYRHPTPFLPDDPRNVPWEQQIGWVKSFFASLPFETLEPHDEWVTSDVARTADRAGRIGVDRDIDKTQAPITAYWCLADPGKCYVAYVRGVKGSLTLSLGKSGGASAEQFNPRTGERTPLPAPQGGSYVYRPPDAQDWVVVVRIDGETTGELGNRPIVSPTQTKKTAALRGRS